jgi:hypothetical protein
MTTTTWGHVKAGICNVRKFEIARQVHRKHLQTLSVFTCPWCGTEIQFTTSALRSRGRRCPCGALFNAHGNSFKRKEET